MSTVRAVVVFLSLFLSAPMAFAQSVSVSPTSASLRLGEMLQFTASTPGLTVTCITFPCYQVTWSVNGVRGGNSSAGTISPDGEYTAPATLPNPATATITATSVANPSKSASATVAIVSNVQISIDPSSVTLDPGVFFRFFATVTGAANTSVTWEVNGITGGNSTVGTITLAGGYTAPLSPPGMVSVTARSVADPTKAATAQVTFAAIQYFITPTSLTLRRGGTQLFTVTSSAGGVPSVRWSVNGVAGGTPLLGTISANGLYTAPSQVPNPATVSVTATSTTDASISATATVTIIGAIEVSINPPITNLQVGKILILTPTVSGSSNTAVTWTVNGIRNGNSAVGTISPTATTGIYLAPLTVALSPTTFP